MSKRLKTKIMADDNRIRMCAVYEASHGLVRVANDDDVMSRFAEFKGMVARREMGLDELEDWVMSRWSARNRPAGVVLPGDGKVPVPKA